MPVQNTKKPKTVKPDKTTGSCKPSKVQKAVPLEPKDKRAKHKRSRSGCFTYRLRRKKCDEGRPTCNACVNLCVKCEYERPMWWGMNEQRKIQKERIKNKIKQTKIDERRGLMPDNNLNKYCDSTLSSAFGYPSMPGQYDVYMPHFPPPPSLVSPSFVAPANTYAPYDIDIKTERQTFVNDVQLRQDSSSSTFSAFAHPHFDATLPTFPEDDLFAADHFGHAHAHGFSEPDPGVIDPALTQISSSVQDIIDVSDYDQPLLHHFIHNVSRLVFPVLDLHQRGRVHSQMIIRSLETNKCYLHCCLSAAAVHLKTTEGLVGEQIDNDIMRHRYEAISQLCDALGRDTNHEKILDATLAMVLFQCSVGPSEDYLMDIPWFDHFQAVSSLADRLALPNAEPNSENSYAMPPLSMTLTSWVDILGSTMIGKAPQFADVYRSKHVRGSMLGLRELTGCDDRIMYLISEIACLDALKNEGRIDNMTCCNHATALGRQLEYTESQKEKTMENPYSPTTGSVCAESLTKNMTTIFRFAARIYLCSLVPGFDRDQLSNRNLVSAVTDTLQYIPSGPNGFDRSLVWPLLITGTFSTSTSRFRTVLAKRAASLGDHARLGSFGRMCHVLEAIWGFSDEPKYLHYYAGSGSDSGLGSSSGSGSGSGSGSSDAFPPSSPSGSRSPVVKQEPDSPISDEAGPLDPTIRTPAREVKPKSSVHWRDVMQGNGWHYLLI